MMYHLIRTLLFKLEPERSHYMTLNSLKILHQLRLIRQKTLSAPRTVMGIQFPNPVGLAAGLDKNGDYIAALAALGFGFMEVGTVTPRPQSGNPKPRIFRIPEAEALINRLGFNNKGVEHLVQQVQKTKFKGILGINIGKNFDVSLENAVNDYLFCMQKIYPFASYIVVNISSPNTPGLRNLQTEAYFSDLLFQLKAEQKKLAMIHKRYVPLVIKIAPDLTATDIKQIANQLLQHDIDGVIATNTTLNKTELNGLPYADEQGGASGKLLFQKSTEIVAQLHAILKDRIPIIGLGGIMNAEDAIKKMVAGASLVQLYTGFIYRGPKLIADIVNKLP